VRSDLVRAGRFLLLPTLAFLFVLAFLPGRVELAIRVYALVVCGVALVLMVAALRRAYPPETPLRQAAKRRHDRRTAPETLARLEQEVALGHAGSFDLHHRLRPRLRGLAAELLAVRRGISLDAEQEQARRVLGEEAYELVRSDRPPPADRLARGIPIPELTRVVESLEQT
jgi:hypothetical protein